MTPEEQKIAELTAENERLHVMVVSLESQLYWLRKKMFGRMSEKSLPSDPSAESQLSLFGDALTGEEQAAPDAEVKGNEEAKTEVRKVKGHERKVRKPVDTSRLEVREEHVYPEVENPWDYREMDPEVTDSLVIVPSQVYIRRIIRHKLVLKSSLQVEDPERKAFALAPVPPMPLPKCMASESVLADIIVEKFMYHMPFYRVIQKYREFGLSVSDSTMNDWYAATCERLRPLYEALRMEIMKTDYIQVDESTVPVIDNEKHKAVKGYMWCTRSVRDGLVAFHYYAGSRSHETARKILDGYRGVIQSDGYGAYDQFEDDPNIKVLACWAHARRKWVEAMEEDSRTAGEALAYINGLYHIENEAKASGITGDALRDKRREESSPKILEFEKWMETKAGMVSKTSRVGKAISYAYALLPRLKHYVDDGRFLMDNNLVENAIRPLALGRKNYLFCGNHDAAVRAAIVYSFIGSCKALGVDPRRWLEDVLIRIPDNVKDLSVLRDLLPDRWGKKSL